MRRFVNVLVLAIVLGFFAKRLTAQKEVSQTEANECRHVAILAGVWPNSTYSARCFIPTIRAFADKFSLFDLIPSEWEWVYNHNGSASGQVLVRADHSVYMISQKDCLDVGLARGPPGRLVYDFFGPNKSHSDVISDFDMNLITNGDAYAECVSNTAQWDSFHSWFKKEKISKENVQMVRKVVSKHEGGGQKLIEYNYNYSNKTLNEVFMKAVNDAINEKRINQDDGFDVVSGIPISINTYPFETGLSVIGPRSLATGPGELIEGFYRDNSNLAWHRALQAKSALSNLEDPPPPLPNELKTGELVSITVLTVLAFFLFERALQEAIRLRAAAIQRWNNPSDEWAFLADEEQGFKDRLKILYERMFSDRTQPLLPALFELLFASQSQGSIRESRAGTLDILLAFITAIASMTAAILEFGESAYRYQKIIIVTSGGVVTYGPSRSELSIQKSSVWAGAEFSVNHWITLNVREVGFRWLEPAVYSICVLLLLYMCHVFLRYSFRREHDLDYWFIRNSFRPIKWSILSLQNILGMCLLNAMKRRNVPDVLILVSYDSVYCGVFNKLAATYGYQELMPDEIPEPRPRRHVFERFKIERFLADGQRQEKEPSAEDGFSFLNPNSEVSRNEIEKCAEVLAADRFGMLGRTQALALMYTVSAANAADRFANDNQLPNAVEIQQLALIYYIKRAVVPGGIGRVVRRNAFRFVNVGDEIRGVGGQSISALHPLAPNSRGTICPLIGYRPRQGDAEKAFMHNQAPTDVNHDDAVWQDEWHNGNVIYLAFGAT